MATRSDTADNIAKQRSNQQSGPNQSVVLGTASPPMTFVENSQRAIDLLGGSRD